MSSRIVSGAWARMAVGLYGLLSCTQVHAAVGRTPASFDVAASGEAMYTIPIAAPPGVRGLAPQLALVYSHRSGQSIAGYGWGIAGYSVIARCPSTKIQDTVPRNVRNDISDRFCLNGNKLRLFAGTYGAAGSEYRTEIETYSRVKAYGTAGNGPAHFIVEGKDGLIYEFGNTPDARIESQGQATARAWALNEVRDRNGNEINFTYFEDATTGSYRLDLVSYGGNPGQGTSAIYTMDLLYEPKPAEEIDSAYLAGSVIQETQRLSRIDVWHNSTTLFRRFDLTYEPALSATKRSRLASLQECAGTGPDCLASTQFTYRDGAPLGSEDNTGLTVNATSVFPIDVNGDGRDDIVYPDGAGPWMVMFASSSGGYSAPISTTIASSGHTGAIPIDHNSDGKMDLLVPYSGGTWWALTIAGNGIGTISNTSAPATSTGTSARAMDIDGDGRQDLVWIEIGAAWAGNDAIRYRKRLPSGPGFDAAEFLWDSPVDEKLFAGIFGDWAQKTPRRTPDFNGDGRGDIVFSRRVRFVDGEPGIPPTYWQYIQVLCPGAPTCLQGEVEAAGNYYFGDFNGDGLSDLFYLTQSGSYRYRLSTGTGFTGDADPGFGLSYSNIVVFDWDSDGYDDVLASAGSTWFVARSNGQALLPLVSANMGSSSGTSAHVVTDLNGDDQADLAYRGSSNTWRYRAHTTSFEYPDVLENATDGFGVTATFAYAPITSSSVYTKGTGAAFPEIDSQRPLWVVSTLTATDGTGNNSTYTLTHTYEAAREHLTGRGFLGSATRNAIDSRLGYNLKTIDTYKQNFPYIGALASREKKRSPGTRLS